MRHLIGLLFALVSVGAAAQGPAAGLPGPGPVPGSICTTVACKYSQTQTFNGGFNFAGMLNTDLPGIDTRPPHQTDDVNAGYPLVSGFWAQKNPFGARVYLPTTVNAGFPQWSIQNSASNPLPCDAVASPLACYGVRQMKASYTGPLINLTFPDAATADVLMLADGRPDLSAFNANVALHGAPARMTFAYDQSGNGRNTTSLAVANQPRVDIDRYGNLRVTADSYALVGGVPTQSTYRHIEIPTSVSYTKNAVSAFSIVSSEDNITSNLMQLGQDGAADGIQVAYFSSTAGTYLLFEGGPAAGPPPLGPVLVSLISGAASKIYCVDGRPCATSGSGYSATAITGGELGMTTGITSHALATITETEWYGTAIWGSALSAANTTLVQTSFHALGYTTPQARCTVIVDGESNDAGKGQTVAWMRQISDKFPLAVRLVNLSVVGKKVSDMVTNYPAYVAPLYASSDACKIIIFNAGTTNDYWNGAGAPLVSAATVEASITSYVALAKATGWTVFAKTPIDRGGGSAATYDEMAAIRDWIIANTSLGYTVLPVHLDLAFSPYNSASANVACYNADAAHILRSCAANMADDVMAVIAPYIRLGG